MPTRATPASDDNDAPLGVDEKFSNLVAQGDLAGLMAFSDLRARIAARDDEGWTPLHWAALYGHAECAGFLLAHGAEVDAVSAAGETPLMIAAESRRKNALAVLLDAGADTARTRQSGENTLDILRAQGASDLLAFVRETTAARHSVAQQAVALLSPLAVRKRAP